MSTPVDGVSYWLDSVTNTWVSPGRIPLPGMSGQHSMLFGAHTQPLTADGFAAFQQRVGGPTMKLHRVYHSGAPATFANTTGTSDNGTGRTSWLSYKYSTGQWAAVGQGQMDAAIRTFAQSCPTDRPIWLTLNHEPENDGGNAANWRSEQRRFYQVVKEVRPDIQVGPVLMDWTADSRSGRNLQDWNPGKGYCDFMAVDTYNTYYFPMVGSPTHWDEAPSDALINFTNLADSLEVPGAIGEVATAEHLTDPYRKAQWIQDITEYCYEHGYIGFAWFDDYKPGDTAQSMLLDSSTYALQAWRTAVETYQH